MRDIKDIGNWIPQYKTHQSPVAALGLLMIQPRDSMIWNRTKPWNNGCNGANLLWMQAFELCLQIWCSGLIMCCTFKPQWIQNPHKSSGCLGSWWYSPETQWYGTELLITHKPKGCYWTWWDFAFRYCILHYDKFQYWWNYHTQYKVQVSLLYRLAMT